MALRQPSWDKYETALLIEAYWKIKADRSQKGTFVAALSSSLRKRATFGIDDTFRNENGINMRLGELDFLFSKGCVGLKNTSDLFREMVEMYQSNRAKYEKVLSEAKEMTSGILGVRMQFCEWLQSKTTKAEPDAACQLLDIGEEFCKRISVLDLPLFETTDADTVKKFVRTVTNNKIFRIRNKKQHPAIVNAANWYYAFIRELPKLSLSTPEEEQKDNITEEKSNQDTHNSEFVPIGNFENDFYQWLRNVENMAIPTCRSYVSALHSAKSFATEHGMETSILCTVESGVALATASALMQDDEFRRFNQQQHNRFSAAFQKLNKFFVYLFPENSDMSQPLKKTNDSTNEKKSIEVVSTVLIESLDRLLRNSVYGITKNENNR